MRTLTAATLLAQKADSVDHLWKAVITDGVTTHTLEGDAEGDGSFISGEQRDERDGGGVVLIMDNSDGYFTSLSLKSFVATVSLGVVLPNGTAVYSELGAFTIVMQEDYSTEAGSLITVLTAEDVVKQQASVHANDYEPFTFAEWSVYTVLWLLYYLTTDTAVTHIFNHVDDVVITVDSQDTLYDTYLPGQAFQVSKDESRLSVIDRLLAYTNCVRRGRADGIHILNPKVESSTAWAASTAYSLQDIRRPTTATGYYYICTSAGTSGSTEPTWPTTLAATVDDNTVEWTLAFDYIYESAEDDAGKHVFFDKAKRQRLVSPNYVEYESFPLTTPSYSGSAAHAADRDLLVKARYFEAELVSDLEGAALAQAKINQAARNANNGSVKVPMNIGAERWDFILVIDDRAEDNAAGAVQTIVRKFGPGVWEMTISFGDQPLGVIALGQRPQNLFDVIDQLELVKDKVAELINQINGHSEVLNTLIGLHQKESQVKPGSFVDLQVTNLHITRRLRIPTGTDMYG